MIDTGAPDALVRRVEDLTARLESLDDEVARETAYDLMGALLELYGRGLERILRSLDESGGAGAAIRDRLANDAVVASLLLIHGLHPVDLETRVRRALETVRPYMESHGGDVELVGLEEGVARLRLQGSCNGCAASASTMELAIEQALEQAAPDLAGIEVEGVVATPAREHASFPGGQLPLAGKGADAGPRWVGVHGLAGLAGGGMVSLVVSGTHLLVANVGGTLLAYENACAGCGSSLEHGELEDGVLGCPSCSRRFALPLAGRAVGGEPLQLAPVPLLAENGTVKVALSA